MKKLILIAITFAILFSMYAQEKVNPVNAYFKEPDATKFKTAIHYLASEATKDTLNMQYPILQAYLYYNEAQRIAEKITANADSLPAGQQFQLANLLLEMHQYNEAIKLYNNINTNTPDWSCPWRHKGEAYYRLNEFEPAVSAFEKAIETNKEHYDAYLWMALTQYELKNYDAAKKYYQESLKLDPNAEESLDSIIPSNKIDALLKALDLKK